MSPKPLPWAFFRLLLVEDDKNLNNDLTLIIRNRFEGIHVDSAENARDALKLLSQRVPYDLSLLDIRIPVSPGDHPEVNWDVAARLKDLKVASICITGYRNSVDVEEYLQQRKLDDPPIKILTKRLNSEFVPKLLNEIQDWLQKRACRIVSSQVLKVFEGNGDEVGPGSGTGELMELQQQILRYWSCLDEETQKLVLQRFVVELSEGRVVAVSLFSNGRAR